MKKENDLKESVFPEVAFGGYSRVDGTVAFFNRVHALLQPAMILLDVGCGRGNAAERFDRNPWEKCRVFKNKCKRVIGIDVSSAGQENPLLDEFRLIEGDQWPIESGSIDILVSDAVLEHVQRPDVYFSECNRVLKPHGYICLRTPNRWGYVSIIAALVPNGLHADVVNRVQAGREARDVFPTYYQANTPRAIRRLLRQHGFSGCIYPHIAEPSYLGFSRLAYGIGARVHRWLPPLLWPTLFVFARKCREIGE